jgi:hypothetical protein
MDDEIPEPTSAAEEDDAVSMFSPIQRLLAGIALAALLASAVISSWWILSGRADFVEAFGGAPIAAESASETRIPPAL